MSSLGDIKPLLTGQRKYNSTWHCVKETVRQEGIIGTYRGIGITMIRAFVGIFSAFGKSLLESKCGHVLRIRMDERMVGSGVNKGRSLGSQGGP